jgi:hypothetical protein
VIQAQRWPLHPAPKEGEALLSWLHRVADCYQMDVRELLEHDLGHGQIDDLDIAPPLPLLIALAQRSGIELDRLRCMSFAGWTPWLLDSLDDAVPSALETYVFQLSVLLPKGCRKTRSMTSWRAWLPLRPRRRACPRCIHDSTERALPLMWQLPLLLSCPTHGCWLETYWGGPGQFMGWENVSCEPRFASAPISAMDRRTWQAFTTGYVELPRRRVHAGLWFRLLRTLLDELNTPISLCGSYGGTIRYVWERCGQPLRAGQSLWHPYEILAEGVQLQMLAAAATAIELIESKILNPGGEFTGLFVQEPQREFTNGLPVRVGTEEPVNYWRKAAEAIEEAVLEARHNPETARSLFRLASYGRNDPASLEQLRAMFAKEQIPAEFLLHYEPTVPFTCRTLSNGLSDSF